MEVVEVAVMVVKTVTDKAAMVALLLVAVTIAAATEVLLQLPQHMVLLQPHHHTIHTEVLQVHQLNLPPHTEATQHLHKHKVTMPAAKVTDNRATVSRVTVNKATAVLLNSLQLQPQQATPKDMR